ncbi:hypothetical protein LCGC14_2513870 [marine sediment metagenome]|uniref:Uncharacterized protein n=1 Tax=marine sediment metagenome TaxID=412755 RepID=A0A0F9DA20_9ZZZZ
MIKDIQIDELWMDFKLLGFYWDSLMGGDTHRVEDAQKLLHKYGLMDADGFWVDQDE